MRVETERVILVTCTLTCDESEAMMLIEGLRLYRDEVRDQALTNKADIMINTLTTEMSVGSADNKAP